jgi:hypothetical protein
MSKVLVRNGGGPVSCKPSLGCGGSITGGGSSPPDGGDELDPAYSCFTVKNGFMIAI